MVPTRFDSASDTPGLNWTRMLKVPSLNGGRNERGSVKAAMAAPTTRMSVTPRMSFALS